MSEKKAKEKRQQTITPEEAKVIVTKARDKDAIDCMKWTQEGLKKFRCMMIGTITVTQGNVTMTFRAGGNNLKIDIVPLLEG